MTITADVRPHTSEAAHEPPDDAQPRWVRPALLVLLLATAALYLWALGSAGWANDYYAAAVQAGTQDWKAWLFGSLDAGNAITVDKPPAALWVMVLSGRIFGFSAFTMLLPQALMGVSAVAVLYATVRRTSGSAAGLIAGAVLALTPVAALMFRFNNPDALLVLLMVVAAYCVVRATETASTRWIALAGCAMGFAFLTKMLQAFLVVPGLRAGVPGRRSSRGVETHRQARRRRRRDDRFRRLVHRPGQSVACRLPAVSSAARPTTACCNSRWATTGLTGSSAEADIRAAGREVVPAARTTSSSAAHRASADCSASRWAPRRPGCCPLR